MTSMLLVDRALLAWTRSGGWRECCALGSQLWQCWVGHRGWSNPWEGIHYTLCFCLDLMGIKVQWSKTQWFPSLAFFIYAKASWYKRFPENVCIIARMSVVKVNVVFASHSSLHSSWLLSYTWLIGRRYPRRSKASNQTLVSVNPTVRVLELANMDVWKSPRPRMLSWTSTRLRKYPMTTPEILQKHLRGHQQDLQHRHPQHW